MNHYSSSSRDSVVADKDDDDDDFEYKDHPSFQWRNNLKGKTSRTMMSLTCLLRSARSMLHRKVNLYNVTVFFLLVGVFLTYLNLNKLHDLVLHQQKDCGGLAKTGAASGGEFIQRKKFALHGRRVDSGYLKHVVEVLESVGWHRTTLESQDWDLLWAHDYPFRILKDQLDSSGNKKRFVNHFPGSGYVTNKMSLATSSLPHVPKAFQLPKDKDKLLKYAADNTHKRFVQKSNNHRGIRISPLAALNLTSNSSFVQEYISNPLLIDGHKFDIGVYTILTSIAPLRLYIHGDVLFRFCPEAYHPFDPDVVDKYVVGDDYLPLWKVDSLSPFYNGLGMGMKASFNAWYDLKRVKSKTGSIKTSDAIWTQVEDAIRAVYLAKEASILETTRKFGNSHHSYFEMVRFDFVIDDDGQVFIMEANMSPNLSSAHFPPNQELYRQVLYNLFKLVGVASVEVDGRSTTDTTSVTSKHLAVFPEECSSSKCLYDCDSVRCSLCAHCLRPEGRDALARAYLESVNQGDTIRIFPPNNRSGALRSLDTVKLSQENEREVEWFRGKCDLAPSSVFC